ncbi:MAG TPA: prolyl oligopeptidase family serine peptidase [Gemmataceae bacterium]|jgi:dienelactone hydrolase|nr:prolyl oligopeptidase family serine peptidase [Gemmataceae bacterium]
MIKSAAVSLVTSLCFIGSGIGKEPESRREGNRIEKGTVHFQPLGDQKNIPERYRLNEHSFDYEMELMREMPNSGVAVYHIRFPSPVKTDCPENNTVHAEYYRPIGAQSVNDGSPFPGVIVLDITAGDQKLSRIIATHLAQNRIAALFVQMAYYGPRRPPGSELRLLTPNYQHTMAAVRQTVLDIRQATAWLEARSEIDSRRLGVLGTSLGSFMGALGAEMEPKLSRVAVLLGGGGLVDAYYDDPRASGFRQLWETLGGTKEKLAELIAPADPITCAANLKDRRVLILAGKRDDIVPPKAAEALWKATGQQKIVWFDCTHYGAVVYFLPAMRHIVKHFAEE